MAYSILRVASVAGNRIPTMIEEVPSLEAISLARARSTASGDALCVCGTLAARARERPESWVGTPMPALRGERRLAIETP
jgi:hypothetical protein